MRERPGDEVELTDGFAPTEAMIEAGGEVIHALYAEPSETDRHNSRYVAERVIKVMVQADAHASLHGA